MREGLKINTALIEISLKSEIWVLLHRKDLIVNNSSSDNGIGDIGAAAIGQALKKNLSLTSIDITGEQSK